MASPHPHRSLLLLAALGEPTAFHKVGQPLGVHFGSRSDQVGRPVSIDASNELLPDDAQHTLVPSCERGHSFKGVAHDRAAEVVRCAKLDGGSQRLPKPHLCEHGLRRKRDLVTLECCQPVRQPRRRVELLHAPFTSQVVGAPVQVARKGVVRLLEASRAAACTTSRMTSRRPRSRRTDELREHLRYVSVHCGARVAPGCSQWPLPTCANRSWPSRTEKCRCAARTRHRRLRHRAWRERAHQRRLCGVWPRQALLGGPARRRAKVYEWARCLAITCWLWFSPPAVVDVVRRRQQRLLQQLRGIIRRMERRICDPCPLDQRCAHVASGWARPFARRTVLCPRRSQWARAEI